MNPVDEIAVAFLRPLRGVVLASPEAPLPRLPEIPQTPIPPPPSIAPPIPPVVLTEPTEIAVPQEALDRQALADALTGLRRAASQLGPQYQSMLGEMRQAAVELALAVASKLLLARAAVGELPLEALIHQVVDRLPVRRKVVVSMHPDDLVLLRRRLGERLAVLDDSSISESLPESQPGQAFSHSGEVVTFHADPEVRRGGCRAEAAGVSVLADLQTQLTSLRQELLESVMSCST